MPAGTGIGRGKKSPANERYKVGLRKSGAFWGTEAGKALSREKEAEVAKTSERWRSTKKADAGLSDERVNTEAKNARDTKSFNDYYDKKFAKKKAVQKKAKGGVIKKK